MLKSREFKNLIYTTLITFVVLFFLSLSFSLGSIGLYKKYIIDNNAKIVSDLVKKYPDKETEIVEVIKENNGDIKNGLKILKKYGIEEDNIYQIKPTKQFRENLILWNIVGIVICFIVIALIYFNHLKKVYKKIEKLNIYINEVLNDRYNFNIKEYEEGMFSTIENDVYKITNKLKEQSEILSKDKKYLEEVLSDISHQLKTPLTSMYMINNLLYDENLDKDLKKEFLHKNQLQLERIEWLVTSLLKLSKLESGTIKLKTEETYVEPLLEKALEPLRIPLELKEQNLIINGNKNIKVIVDKNWTTEALLNIIKNAHEHTYKSGTIKIEYKDNPLYIEILIKDNGEGIDESDINHIFERFYKGKGNNKDSIGIGLNMAKKIIEKQNGDISVTSKKNVGTTFSIKFYKNNI